ncbi:hypothetical protein QE152_g7113 [Popillia japonica]|uniref:Uncharacterized protein n=1 Tax=Popillia japonica TaxID=7064 RepID=A0AAW1MGC7_POPJA
MNYFLIVIMLCVVTGASMLWEGREVLSGMLEVHLMDERTLFVGDFNLPNFVFESFSCTKTAIFLHLCNVLNLQQHNTVLNNDGKLLDLVLSDGHVDVSINRADSPVVVEDIYHPALEINIKLLMDQKQQNFPTANTCYMDFRRANCDVLSGALSDMDWTFLLSYDNVDHALDCFYKRLYSVLESHTNALVRAPVTIMCQCANKQLPDVFR